MIRTMAEMIMGIAVGTCLVVKLSGSRPLPMWLLDLHGAFYTRPVNYIRRVFYPTVRGHDASAGCYWLLLVLVVILAR